MIEQALAAFLLAFPALFSIVNPPGGAIIFNEVTAGHSHDQRAALARRVAVYSTFVMLGALWFGTYVLSFFGVSLDALRIAGGLVVSARAYEMLSAPGNTQERKQREAQPAAGVSSRELGGYAFFPLTLPFTTGPGTIAVAISLGTARPDKWAAMGAFYAGATGAVLAMALLIWASYAMADRLAAVLGETGRVVVARLAAFLLLGIGVQIALNGIVPVLHRALG
ncbi:MarC family protein [Acidocella sp.]|uniref:MarC family protein n=1 Tax=Acidocella sp. TaxID=50710 RepID=UPI00261C25B3|nr:NAAT family transporter [Acidocella sp.]